MKDWRTKYTNNNLKLNNIYHAMMSRCYNPKTKAYRWYGAIGVIVCEDWKNDYQKFLDWALSNGWEQGLQLDKDIKGDGMIYSPETCCFVSHQKNNRARKHLLKVDYKGEERLLIDVCEELGLNPQRVKWRINYGMTFEEAIARPTGVGNASVRYKTKQK